MIIACAKRIHFTRTRLRQSRKGKKFHGTNYSKEWGDLIVNKKYIYNSTPSFDYSKNRKRSGNKN